MNRAIPTTRDAYRHFINVPTRWMDNDAYGHVNNVVYYSYFDTAVTKFLMDLELLGPQGSALIGLVVSTQCQYFAPLSFPDEVVVGLAVATIGNSSVTYHLAAFKIYGSTAVAQGQFIHVYVDEESRLPVKLPPDFRQKLTPSIR